METKENEKLFNEWVEKCPFNYEIIDYKNKNVKLEVIF